ncbi:MAG: OmpA family protein [Verrucomicrobiota bacterium]
MNRPSFLNLSIMIGLALSLSVAGCKKRTTGITRIPEPQPPVIDNSASPGIPAIPSNTSPGSGSTLPTDANIGTTALPEERGPALSWPQDRETLKAQTLYFDYDKATVQASERSKVESVASYLKNEAAVHLLVEGHCDERGTEEYNRSLGERRALAVREYLITLGVGPERVHTKSLGESQPADPGHDDAAWKKNRRAEFVLLRPR